MFIVPTADYISFIGVKGVYTFRNKFNGVSHTPSLDYYFCHVLCVINDRE